MEEVLVQLSGSSDLLIYSVAFGVLLACGFGFPLPEDVVLFSLGYLSYRGDVHLAGSIFVALAGVLLGDSTIYLIGRILGDRIARFPLVNRLLRPDRVEKVRRAFEANGAVYLFFARFAPGVRAVTFWTAGYFRIPFRTFFLLDGLAAVLSVPLFTWIGYLLGEAFHESIQDAKDVVLLVAVLGFGVILYVTLKHVRRQRLEEAEDGGPTRRSGAGRDDG